MTAQLEYAKAIIDLLVIAQEMYTTETGQNPNSPYIREREKVGGSERGRERSTEGE